MPITHPSELPDQMTLVSYPDPVVEAHGYGPDHPYPEAVLTSRVGPSTLVLWRRCCRLVAASPNPVDVDTADLLACIGLKGLGRNSTGARTIARMVAFDMARRAGHQGAILAVRTALAPLSPLLADRLPPSARRDHDRLTARPITAAATALTPGANL